VDLGGPPLEPVNPPAKGGSTKDNISTPPGDSGIDLGDSGIVFEDSPGGIIPREGSTGEIEISPSGINPTEEELMDALEQEQKAPPKSTPGKPRGKEKADDKEEEID